MRQQGILKNNKGASLVLIIVAMMFVGIIASIVLTLTVGNSKSAKATVDTSENFYSSESILDDLEMYLKKFATSAATEAYAATLEEGLDSSSEGNFREKFKTELVNRLKNEVLGVYGNSDGSGNYVLDPDFVKNQVTFDRYGDIGGKISISYKTLDETSYPAVLKGVVITYTDNMGYETTLTTDITFKANLPSSDMVDSSEEFTYDIDHFIIISGRNVAPALEYLSGDWVGNIYANGNIKVSTKTPAKDSTSTADDVLNLYSQYVLAKNNINVSGRLNINPIRIGSGDTEFKSDAGVWCNNMLLSYTDSSVNTGKDDALVTDLFLKGNLELNGKNASYTADGGNIYGYSSSTAAYFNPNETGAVKPVSSAIVLNGLGAQLDLESLSSLNLAGTAYTALPDISGVNQVYEYYNGTSSTEPDGVYYYTQGDSVTYRALQALYLIPGDYIKGVGHNPMKQSEFSSIKKENIETPKDLFGDDYTSVLNSGKFKSHIVRYLNGENYVYLFWDFKSVNNAIEYFNKVSSGRYSGLFDKQLGILGENSGYIKLPSNVKTDGYAVKYDSTATPKFAKVGTSTPSLDEYISQFDGLMTTLDKGKINGTDLISNMFTNFDSSHLAYQMFNETLPAGPYTSYNLEDGTKISFSETGTMEYQLVTGPNVQIGTVGGHSVDETGWNVIDPDTSKTYIIITPGNVELRMSGVTLRCLIIAGGDVTVNNDLDLECMGMVKRTATRIKEGETSVTDEPKVISEFKALLAAAPNDADMSNANTRLRRIFNVADTSISTGSDDGSNFVVIETSEWKRN